MAVTRVMLEENEIPTHWYNVVADLPHPPTPPIRACVDEALRCKESGEPKTLLFNLSGHGHFDMLSYDRYFAGELADFEYPQEAIAVSLAHLPKVG